MAHLHDWMHVSRSSTEKSPGRRVTPVAARLVNARCIPLYRDEVGTALEALPYLHHVGEKNNNKK